MIVSLLYQVTRGLLSVLAVLRRPDTAKDAELQVLGHENAVLRRQLREPRRHEPVGRRWHAVAWHRQLIARRWDYSHKRGPGHPPTKAAIERLVLLDEATTQVDGPAEAAIHDCIRRRAAVGAVVRVAQRLPQ